MVLTELASLRETALSLLSKVAMVKVNWSPFLFRLSYKAIMFLSLTMPSSGACRLEVVTAMSVLCIDFLSMI